MGPDLQNWPDGEPVTPWADPWHDVLGGIRQFIAAEGRRVIYSAREPGG